MAFEPVHQVAALMKGFDRPWFVAGGWALDLFVHRQTRDHEDVEIAVFRRDQGAVWRQFSGWAIEKVVAGNRQGWRGEWLAPPVHELHAKRERSQPPELEILLDEAWADTWRFRRNLAVTKPLAEFGLRSSEGIPYLAPEIALLYKAKHGRPRDEADFRAVLPTLDAHRRAWLRAALEACHTGHPWIASL